MAFDQPTTLFGDLMQVPTRNGIHKGPAFQGRGVPVIKMGEVYNADIITDQARDLLDVFPNELDRLGVQPGDLLFCRTSLVADGVGHCALVAALSAKSTFASNLIRVRLDPANAVPRFWFYYFRSPQGKQQLLSRARGTSVTTITGPDISLLPVPSLGIEEQHAIAHVLGTLDDKIQLNRRMNESLEAIARVLFKSWFVDFDPFGTKAEGRRPEVSDIVASSFPSALDSQGKPTSWHEVRLLDLAEVLSGGTPSKGNPEFWSGAIPWISPKAMSAIQVSDADDRITDRAVAAGARVVPKGTVLVMVRGMGLHQGVRVSQACREVAFNQDVKAIVPRTVDGVFLLWALLHSAPFLHSKVQAAGHGTGVLPTDVLLGLKFVLPPPGQREALLAPLAAITAKIQHNSEQNVTLATLRDTLLPKLISGELRVKDADRLVSRAA